MAKEENCSFDLGGPTIKSSYRSLDENQVIEFLLPRSQTKNFSLDEIDKKIDNLIEDLIQVLKSNNDQVEFHLNETITNKLKNLYPNLHKIQLNVMKLGCDIAFAKEQFNVINSFASDPLIKERSEIIEAGGDAKSSPRKLIFKPLNSFYGKFADYLSTITEDKLGNIGDKPE